MSQDIQDLMRRARETMDATSKEIEAAGGVDNYGGEFERVEWDLSLDYRATIEECKVVVPESGSPRLTVTVKAFEPTEFKGNKAWLTFWLSEKAIQYAMKDLTPVLIKAGVTRDQLNLFDEEAMTEQLAGQSVVFSLKPSENNPDFPEKRWFNTDRGQKLRTNHPIESAKPKLAKPGEIEEEPFPDEVAEAPSAPVIRDLNEDTVDQAAELAKAKALIAAMEAEQAAQAAQEAPVVAPVSEAPVPPVGTGVVLPPGLG